MSKVIKEEKRSVITDYGEIKYTLYYKDVKNLNIKFKIDKGVLVTIPKKSDYIKAENFIKEKAKIITSWIEKYKENEVKISERKFEEGEQFLLLGTYYILKLNKVKKASENKVIIDGNNIILNTLYLDNVNYKRKIVEKFYSDLTKRILSQEYQILKNKCSSKIPNTEYYSLKIRHMKSRWGSNNLTNRIVTLTSTLIFAPIEDIDYVIIHELCHCAIRNHSSVFYSYQSMICPDWKERKNHLNRVINPYIKALEKINSKV